MNAQLLAFQVLPGLFGIIVPLKQKKMSTNSHHSMIPGRICPSCGTRMAETASHCAACGMVFETRTDRAPNNRSRLLGSSAGLNLPSGIFIAGPIILLVAGALLVVFLTRPRAIPDKSRTPTFMSVNTATIALTFMPSNTPTIFLSPSVLPPIMITVKAGDTCYGLASEYGYQDPSVLSDINGRPVDCNNLQPGDVVYIPRPTPTLASASTTDQNALHQTETACPIDIYTVVYGDTLGGIAAKYQVSIESIKKWNPQYSFVNDVVFDDAKLRIPLCERLSTEGPSPTPATPPT
jgi:LysM repeat protein